MSEYTSGNTPGFQTQQDSQESEVLWSGRKGQDLVATKKITVLNSTVDSGNTPTTTIRGGNVLSVVDASGKVNTYSPDANDGRQIAVGILEHNQDMLVNGVATDRFTQMLVHGLVRDGELINLDLRAKQQLGLRFLFDREVSPQAGVLMHPRGVYRKSSNYTVVAGDNGLLFIATAQVSFTLPTKQNGLAFRFLQTSDNNLVITGSSDIVAKNNASASSVTFGTANEKIGSHVLVECVYVNTSTLKWIVTNLGATTPTVA
ncbi:MAG TPA: hypothetical protein VGI40_07625 [Pirellulaceae bacterium]|jgi:hypothetical protein